LTMKLLRWNNVNLQLLNVASNFWRWDIVCRLGISRIIEVRFHLWINYYMYICLRVTNRYLYPHKSLISW
jgi:hypothetical protein